jgi:hypothetical protein
MNESVGGQNSREIRKRFSGGKKKTAALEFIALMLKTRLGREDSLRGEFLCLCASARDDVMPFRRRSFLRSVIGLTEFERKGFDEVGACAQKDVFFERYCDEGGPAGMGAKPEGSMLHKPPQGVLEYAANITRRMQNGKC